jgi:hypothetical protein
MGRRSPRNLAIGVALAIQESAIHGNQDGVRPVVCLEFGQNILHVTFDCIF